jgi:hypothetical protein
VTVEFNAEYVLSRYYHEENGVEYVYYPARSAKRLLVTFASLNPTGLEFNRIRQFWSESEEWSETAFLFFRDSKKTWYANHEPIVAIIRRIGSVPVFTCGSSMGAYGALVCGLELAVAGVLLTALTFPVDTDALFSRLEQVPLPKCYIEARGASSDQYVLDCITCAYRRRGGLCTFRSMPEAYEHWAIDLWKPKFTLFLMDTMERWES